MSSSKISRRSRRREWTQKAIGMEM